MLFFIPLVYVMTPGDLSAKLGPMHVFRTAFGSLRMAVLFLGLCALTLSPSVSAVNAAEKPVPGGDARIPLAVIGDSDSQGFHDIHDPNAPAVPRGGRFADTTFQWTEALAKLRGDQLDLGEWGVHGMRGRVAAAIEWVGLANTVESWGWEIRAPKKRDHRYNFAYSGDGCRDLFGGWSRQVPRLVRTMDAEASRWRNGIVVIRIGGNDFANDVTNLGLLAKDPQSPVARAKMDMCLSEIRRAVALIHGVHPQTRIVLVGVFNNVNWERMHDQWHSPTPLANISKGLDYYDDALQAMVKLDPRLAFFNDRQWFEGIWGSRGSDGRPDYRVYKLGPQIQVTNRGGDAPTNASLADGHAGLVWNAKWAQALVTVINSRYGLKLTPVTDDDVLRFVMNTGGFQRGMKENSKDGDRP
jgi:hypothetical protein